MGLLGGAPDREDQNRADKNVAEWIREANQSGAERVATAQKHLAQAQRPPNEDKGHGDDQTIEPEPKTCRGPSRGGCECMDACNCEGYRSQIANVSGGRKWDADAQTNLVYGPDDFTGPPTPGGRAQQPPSAP